MQPEKLVEIENYKLRKPKKKRLIPKQHCYIKSKQKKNYVKNVAKFQ